MLTPDACVAIEPALAPCRLRVAGGIFTATDESGDARRFTQELAQLALARGVVFRWGTTIEALVADGGAVRGARCRGAHDREPRRRETIAADAYVVSLGSFSPFVLAPIGVPAPIYPVKGYSATIAIGDRQARRPCP